MRLEAGNPRPPIQADAVPQVKKVHPPHVREKIRILKRLRPPPEKLPWYISPLTVKNLRNR
jgi:hypothetical protein